MITEYVHAAMGLASYEIIDDRTFYGEIPGFKGVYANESSLKKCKEELMSVLEDWILFSISKRHNLPKIKTFPSK